MPRANAVAASSPSRFARAVNRPAASSLSRAAGRLAVAIHMKPAQRAGMAFAARQTFSGVAGMSKALTPSASVIAFITAAGDAIAPASPQPFTPSGLDGDFVIVVPTSKFG